MAIDWWLMCELWSKRWLDLNCVLLTIQSICRCAIRFFFFRHSDVVWPVNHRLPSFRFFSPSEFKITISCDAAINEQFFGCLCTESINRTQIGGQTPQQNCTFVRTANAKGFLIWSKSPSQLQRHSYLFSFSFFFVGEWKMWQTVSSVCVHAVKQNNYYHGLDFRLISLALD